MTFDPDGRPRKEGMNETRMVLVPITLLKPSVSTCGSYPTLNGHDVLMSNSNAQNGQQQNGGNKPAQTFRYRAVTPNLHQQRPSRFSPHAT